MANSELRSDQSISTQKANEITVGDTAPTNPQTGNIWLDTSEDPPDKKTYDGTSWVPERDTAIKAAIAYT